MSDKKSMKISERCHIALQLLSKRQKATSRKRGDVNMDNVLWALIAYTYPDVAERAEKIEALNS